MFSGVFQFRAGGAGEIGIWTGSFGRGMPTIPERVKKFTPNLAGAATCWKASR